MTNATQTILVVDSNAETRATLTRQLASTGCKVLEAENGVRALEIVQNGKIRLVVSDLYMKTGESDCLIQAIRQNRVHGTRTLAHVANAKSSDKVWAKRWGARAFLIQPAQTARLEYVVSQLLMPTKARSDATSKLARRKTLNGALAEVERGELAGTSSVVVSKSWWNELTDSQRSAFRKRAKKLSVALRSDEMMGQDFVEVRGAQIA
jgi:CheY-like chemotaxis protein